MSVCFVFVCVCLFLFCVCLCLFVCMCFLGCGFIVHDNVLYLCCGASSYIGLKCWIVIMCWIPSGGRRAGLGCWGVVGGFIDGVRSGG